MSLLTDTELSTELSGKPFWKIFSMRDAIYIVILVYMLMNQHFNNEERLVSLETSQHQIVDTLATIQKDMVPRKESDTANQALSIRLGNIEAAQNNIMTYLLNRNK